MTIGRNVETKNVDVELEEILDNLRFFCTTPDGFSEEKYEHYKEQLLSQYLSDSSNDVIVVESEKEESKIPTIPLLNALSSNGPMESAWPMAYHDTRHTSRSPYSTASTTSAEKWRFYNDGWVQDTPIIDSDGTIYIGKGWDLVAVNPDGTEKWMFRTDGLIRGSSPAIAEDGTIYVGSWNTKLYAINPNGALKWKSPGVGGNIASSPALADDGTIYVGTMSSGNSIVAVSPNGTIKWSYPTGYMIVSDPCIGDDGTVYIGSGDDYLYAMNPDGTLKWRFKTGDWIQGHPSIATDGTIYIGSFDDYLYALYPNNGTLKWKCGVGPGTETNPSIGNDGTIYVGSDKLYAIYPDGTMRWSFNPGADRFIISSPAISAEGTIYFGTNIGEVAGGEIIAVNSDGAERWRKRIANAWVDSSPSIAEDGTVYIGCAFAMSEGYLHAFGVGELEADTNGPYYGLINQPVQFTGTSSGGYSPHSYHWDFGDTYTSEEQNPTHIYTNPGSYDVVLTVTDDEDDTAVDTTFTWIQTTNTPPNKPTINGPNSGNAGTSYSYTFTANDPDGSSIYYYIDWGDNTNSGWLGPYDSDETITESHTWSNQGTLIISAKAKDPYNEEGPWGTLEVTMPRNRATQTPFFNFLENHPNMFPILRQLLGL